MRIRDWRKKEIGDEYEEKAKEVEKEEVNKT
jgi:hypothetical protein